MQRIKLVGFTVLAIFASSAMLATTAAYAEEKEPEIGTEHKEEIGEKAPLEFTDKSGTMSLASGTRVIKCVKSTSTGKFTSVKKGKIDILFTGCTSAGGVVECTSLTSTTKGSILMKGEIHLRYIVKPPSPDVALVILSEEIHILCGPTLLLVKGCIPGLITPINTLVGALGTYIVNFKRSGSKQEPNEIFKETGNEKQHCHPELLETAGEFKEAAMEVEDQLEKFEKGGVGVATEIKA